MRLVTATLVVIGIVSLPNASWAQLIGTNIDSTVVTTTGTGANTKYEIQSLTVGDFNTTRAQLTTGLVSGTSDSPDWLGTWPSPYINPAPAGNLDINSILAKNDTIVLGQPIDVTGFGRNLGVTSGNWKGTNGSDPDFFLYEAAAATGDIVDVQAILPGGVFGQTLFLPLTNLWGDTMLDRQGNPNGGQSLVGIAISVQDLTDASGVNLSATAELEGLRILSDGIDLASVSAINPGILPLRLSVNTSTGEVSIVNPNSTTYTIGLNHYRITSASSSLNNDTWNSLDEQEGADLPGDGWEVGGGSFPASNPTGDYNDNGTVDAADFVVWRETNINGPQGYIDWRANFGITGGSGTATNQLLELRNDGLTTIGPNGSIPLGQAFSVGGTQDLVFRYGVDDGLLVDGGAVVYSGSGGGTVIGSTVPEPASLALVSLAALVLLGLRSQSNSHRKPMHITSRRPCNLNGRTMGSTTPRTLRVALLAVLAIAASGSRASAVIIAQDDFDYQVGALAGNNGGTGWGGAWGAPGVGSVATVIDVTGNPLEFTPSGGSLLSGGSSALEVKADTPPANIPAGGRALASAQAQTFYAGYLVRYDGDDFAGTNNTFSLHLSNSETNTTSINFGLRGLPTPDGNEFMVRSGTGGPVAGASAGGEVVIGNEYLLLAKMTYSGTNYDQVDVWINPTTTPGTPDMTLSLDAGTGLSAISHVFFRQAANQQGDIFAADRLVLGTEVSDILGVGVPVPSVTIDRSTGEVSLTNSFNSDLQVVKYSLASAAGGLSTTGWTPIAGRLDAGNGTFDPDSAWTVTSNTANSLAEAANTGNGGTLAMNSNLGIGNAWVRSPFDDVSFQFQLDGGDMTPGAVSYIGTGPIFGDLNDNGSIEKGDFVILSQNSYRDISGETTIGAYLKGDLDGDKDNDFDDFQLFRRLFTEANGEAAFVAILSDSFVPEPSAVSLLTICGVLLLGRRGDLSRRKSKARTRSAIYSPFTCPRDRPSALASVAG